MTKQELLTRFLMEEEGKEGEEINIINSESFYSTKGEYTDTITGNEYLILSDLEADDRAGEEIKQSLWAFNPDFILAHTNLDYKGFQYAALIKCIRTLQEALCESANDIIKLLISNLDDFIDDAINADGRGHFLSCYDGVENEIFDPDTHKYYYIYRIH